MSALGQKQTLKRLRLMSALPPKADIGCVCRDVRFVPIADMKCAAGNTDHHHPKDIFGKVSPLSQRNFGLSAEVNRGNRPAHKSGKKTGSGIDSLDSVQFKKHRDYR
jgi:hypothetical protein